MHLSSCLLIWVSSCIKNQFPFYCLHLPFWSIIVFKIFNINILCFFIRKYILVFFLLGIICDLIKTGMHMHTGESGMRHAWSSSTSVERTLSGHVLPRMSVRHTTLCWGRKGNVLLLASEETVTWPSQMRCTRSSLKLYIWDPVNPVRSILGCVESIHIQCLFSV